MIEIKIGVIMSNGKFKQVFENLFKVLDNEESISVEVEGILNEHMKSVKSDLESTLKNRDVCISNSAKGMKSITVSKPKGKFDVGHIQQLFSTSEINYNIVENGTTITVKISIGNSRVKSYECNKSTFDVETLDSFLNDYISTTDIDIAPFIN